MDKLLHTSLFRAILKSLNRKVVSEKRLQTYFLKFARLITALCDDTDCLSALHTLNYTQIQFRFLLSRIHEPSVSLPPYIHRVVDMTLEFICLEKELLYHRIEHPRSFISEPAFTSPLHWSKHYPAISVSEILCGLDRMTPPPFVLVRQLHSIWLFGSSRIHCMLNSAIRLMSNAVFWNARKIAQNLPMHCFIP